MPITAKQTYDASIGHLDAHVFAVGGKVKLKNMKQPEYMGTFMDVYGVEFCPDGTTKYTLRVSRADSVRSYNGKYIKVNADRVDKTRFHGHKDVFLASPIFAATCRKAGLVGMRLAPHQLCALTAMHRMQRALSQRLNITEFDPATGRPALVTSADAAEAPTNDHAKRSKA